MRRLTAILAIAFYAPFSLGLVGTLHQWSEHAEPSCSSSADHSDATPPCEDSDSKPAGHDDCQTCLAIKIASAGAACGQDDAVVVGESSQFCAVPTPEAPSFTDGAPDHAPRAPPAVS